MRLACVLLSLPVFVFAADWPDWRGPGRDGKSSEKNLPEKWSPKGDNLAWKAPYGARSAPTVMGNHVYVQNAAGKGETLQERVMCFDADTGKVLWEHRFNVYLSDVPTHRVGWASPAADPETGNVYAFGVGGTLLALTSDGKLLWERPLGEDLGLVTTHGGRTQSPAVDGGLVIVGGLNSGWGAQARAANRYFAFDKRTGETVWASTPGGRPLDTTYAPPVIATLGGLRLFINGGGDGAVHALKVATGEPVWSYDMTKRGVNTGAVISGNTVIVSHGQENVDTNEMGLLAAIDGTARGKIGPDKVKWSMRGFIGEYSTAVIDGDRVYQIDNGSNLYAFDAQTGKQLWKLNLGTIQKSSPVFGDGKLYVGTESGKFYILRPHQDRCEVLSENLLGAEENPEAVIGSAAVSNGRIYFASLDTFYAIGKKRTASPAATTGEHDRIAPGAGPVAHVQIVPAESIVKPGESVRMHARLFNANGEFLREAPAAWSLQGLKGTIDGGAFTASSDRASQSGLVKATVEGVAGEARIRVIPPLPMEQNFDSLAPNTVPASWINATGKFVVREMEGNKVLAKLADNPFTKRARAFFGLSESHDYTIECDVRAIDKQRRMGDAGVVAQRYELVLFGNNQKLELQPWQPETARTVSINFPWKGDTWYRLKLRVENLPDGKVRARGKAWPASEPEPAAWTIERVDPIGNREGSPGLYADAQWEVFFDNLKVTSNQ